MTLDAIDASYRSGRARVLAVLDGLPGDAANRKPAAGVWSAAEVVAHLNIIAADYLPALDRAVARARAGDATGDQPLGLVGRLYAWGVGPDGFEMKTFASMAPPASGPAASALDIADVRSTFGADMTRLTDLVALARHRAPMRVGLPEFPVVRIRVVAVLAGLAAHVHRHAGQMERRAALRTGSPAR